MGAYEKSAAKNNDAELAKEAQKIGSSILQTDINYRDIKARMDKIRELSNSLGK